ncbi:MAG: type II toxin-antitoxin system CcdA family antitoxin [Bacteroidetes bacterium]|nr:type II toxin-antitoxin system CcdA family antitoxin [Bacteroidota bacterium]
MTITRTRITISVEPEVIETIRRYNLNASRICNKALKDWAGVVNEKMYNKLIREGVN